ncbi:MAG TPA: SAM-dependent methyltransferase [Terriglobales bacterium]|nr:SAM-dependent methyltransferase [Terriglobales bacterium]
MTLREKILAAIRNDGPIPFSRYMEMCLYDPELGYYSQSGEQFGKAGDFYTSSDVHAVFGRLLTRQFEEMWRALGSPSQLLLVELGPGRGLFALDVLDWAEKKFPKLFSAMRYVLVERSGALRKRLATTLERPIRAEKAQVIEQVELPHGVPVIIFGNEFFDAFPVEVVSTAGMLHVGEKDGKLAEVFLPITPAVDEYVDRYAVRPEAGERVEAGLAAFQEMRKIAEGVEQGFIVFIDYGYAREELLAGRHRGTVMAYRRHSASPNPYEASGEQDITAHVNFTAIAAAAEKVGLQTERLLTQSQFLMGIGESNQFADAFEECKLPQERAKVMLQLKHLVTPVGMGEMFHVLVGSKGVHAADIEKLSGLRFARR